MWVLFAEKFIFYLTKIAANRVQYLASNAVWKLWNTELFPNFIRNVKKDNIDFLFWVDGNNFLSYEFSSYNA